MLACMKSLVGAQTYVQSLPTMLARMNSLAKMQTYVQSLPTVQARMAVRCVISPRCRGAPFMRSLNRARVLGPDFQRR